MSAHPHRCYLRSFRLICSLRVVAKTEVTQHPALASSEFSGPRFSATTHPAPGRAGQRSYCRGRGSWRNQDSHCQNRSQSLHSLGSICSPLVPLMPTSFAADSAAATIAPLARKFREVPAPTRSPKVGQSAKGEMVLLWLRDGAPTDSNSRENYTVDLIVVLRRANGLYKLICPGRDDALGTTILTKHCSRFSRNWY
jgi:hypothetical protein